MDVLLNFMGMDAKRGLRQQAPFGVISKNNVWTL